MPEPPRNAAIRRDPRLTATQQLFVQAVNRLVREVDALPELSLPVLNAVAAVRDYAQAWRDEVEGDQRV